MSATARTIVNRTHNLPGLEGDQIRLEAGGDGWMGTFGVVAQVMVRDIVEGDGTPVYATLVYENPSGDRWTRLVVSGEIASVEDGFVFVDGYEADIDGLIAVTI